MGWQSRDWAKWTPEERDAFLGSDHRFSNRGPRAPAMRRRGFGFRDGVGIAVVVSGVLFGLGHLPAGHPVLKIPSIHLSSGSGKPTATSPVPVSRGLAKLPRGTVAVDDHGIPLIGPPLRIPIRGRAAVRAGTIVHVTGIVPLRRGGIVRVKMRRAGGIWHLVRRAHARRDGSYSIRYALPVRGIVHVRIDFAGGSFAYKRYRVTR